MNSRTRLVVGLLVVVTALTGCSATTEGGSIDLTPVNDTVIAERASHPVEPRTDSGQLAKQAIETGGMTVTETGGHPDPKVSDGRTYRYNGAYYEVSSAVVRRNTTATTTITIDGNTSNVTADGARLAEFPPVDRRVLEALFPLNDTTSQGPEALREPVAYTDAELENSTLVEAEETNEVIVRVDGERYRVRAAPPRFVTRVTARYTTEKLATSDTAYADHVRAEYQFTLSDLPADEREVVSQAASNTYTADGENDAAFEAVVERIQSHDRVEAYLDSMGGQWLVRWQGQTYLVEIYLSP